jgi:DNA (cytosine-5)-methyltransferase 1
LEPSRLWWKEYLKGTAIDAEFGHRLSIADLFCGCGGLSLGVYEAARAVGLRPRTLLSVDADAEALEVYRRNFAPEYVLAVNAGLLTDYHVYSRGEEAALAYEPAIVHPKVKRLVGKVDVLVAGPPCQGHSNLNNHTRRDDPRNQLYVATAATGIALKAGAIIIENVPEVTRDSLQVVATVTKILEDSNYSVSDAVLNATELGAGQTRKRHFLVATCKKHVVLKAAAELLKKEPLTLRELIGDLEARPGTSFMDEVPMFSQENQARIDYLFDNEEYNLPDNVRPDCHKNGTTYTSVYGRLRWDKPAQTITTGFVTPGRGRFIHPSQRRVLTPREAARIQGFPDGFDFLGQGEPPSRTLLAKWIGDAVPTQLGYSAVLAALSGL